MNRQRKISHHLPSTSHLSAPTSLTSSRHTHIDRLPTFYYTPPLPTSHPANQPAKPLHHSPSTSHHDFTGFRRSFDCRCHNHTPTYNNCSAHTTDDMEPSSDCSEASGEWVVGGWWERWSWWRRLASSCWSAACCWM